MLADAFIDDPGWLAVGPNSQKARWKFIYRTCMGAIRIGERSCGPSWCITNGGEPIAVLTGAAPGRWPVPQARALLDLAPGPILAGPPTLVRSLRTQRVIEKAHPEYPHFLVWMFAVSPAHQRRGLGGRLMRKALAAADADEVPAYLYTGNPDNLPYYRSHGYEVLSEAITVRGAPSWFMQREPIRASSGPRAPFPTR